MATIAVRATTPCEAPALADFLRRRFPGGGVALADENNLRWKYWSDREDWPGSRSFTARHRDAIVGHAAAWPVRIRISGKVLQSIHVIDWAADPTYSAAGLWLMRQMCGRASVAIAIGGRELTQRILPALGFRPHGEVQWFARPLRPLRQALTTPRKNWRLPVRLLRNTVWRLSALVSAPDGCSAMPFTPEAIPETLWPQPSRDTAVTARDAALYRHILQAPSVRHSLFGFERRGQLVGYFCMAFTPNVARIADLWLPSTSVDDWCAAFRTATSVAAREATACEVTACASTELGKTALARAGYHVRDRSMLSVFGDTDALKGRALHVQMLDCDASVLLDDHPSYLT